MKKAISILLLGVLPAWPLAAGDHAGGHHQRDLRGTDGGHHDMADAMHDAGIGQPGDPAAVSRTIEVMMDDRMRFAPDRIRVKAGETIRFFVRNSGRQQHELVLGTMAALREHAAMMRAEPDMKHAEPHMTSVRPGRLGGIVWRFDHPGTVHFACLVPGHLEAGMIGQVEVE